MAIAHGHKFGRYLIEKTLGSGGMGSVYLARDTSLRRSVALKTLGSGTSPTEIALERFHREARVAAEFRHPNLCKVIDVGEIDGVHYLTMELIAGRSLADMLQPGVALPPVSSSVAIAQGVASGLAEAHRFGVIHRDLKPSNIIIEANGNPVIVDFGLARGDVEGESSLTETGVFLGTRNYASPEQWQEDPALIGPPSDIYSLGVILYQMLCGKLPFSGPTLARLMHCVLSAQPDPPSVSRPGLNARLDEICLQALAKSPADRFSSMNEFASALRAFADHAGPEPGSAEVGAGNQDDSTGEWPPSGSPVAATMAESSRFEKSAVKQPLTDLETFSPHHPRRSIGGARLRSALVIVACLTLLVVGVRLVRSPRQVQEPSLEPDVASHRLDASQTSVDIRVQGTAAGTTADASRGSTAPAKTSSTLVPPCDAMLTTKGDSILDVVRTSAFDHSARAEPVRAGQRVHLVQTSADRQTYLALDMAGKELGWIPTKYLVPAATPNQP